MSEPESDRAERDRLVGYIVASRRVQRRLGVGLAVAAVAAVVAIAFAPTIGALAVLAVGIMAVCGFWVTAAHIADWRMQITRLDARQRGRAAPRPSTGTARPSLP